MATHTLVLIRHAKAAPHGPSDLTRPLTVRGHRDARAVGSWLTGQRLDPDLAITSPALRAVQTWADAADQLARTPVSATDERIYDSDLPTLLAVIHDIDDHVGTVALVGHNPGIAALATALDDGRGEATAAAELARGYPTSGTTVFEVPTAWARLELGAGLVRAFAAPRG